MINGGFLLIDKKIGLSSQTVDRIIKKRLSVKKVGHLGTLDPLASGLLIVGVNDGTRFFKYMEESTKKYTLRLRIGSTTKTLDNEGEIEDFIDIDLRGKEELIDSILKRKCGKYDQIPPMYSAIKKDGVPLYKLALKGQEIELTPRKVEIFEARRTTKIEYIDRQSYVSIDLFVSKGFYVRSFAKELGEELNLPTMADGIRRNNVDSFSLIGSKDVDEVSMSDIKSPLDYLDFKRIEISDETYNIVKNGARLKLDSDDEYVLLTKDNEEIAIYKRGEGIYCLDFLIHNESRVY